MSNALRKAVSKNKRRFVKDGYDLDLAYINSRIIAMGFPSEKMEGMYRNPYNEVIRFLDEKHKDHYRVYNLCSERGYDLAKFNQNAEIFPFDDHNPPPFEMIEQFCRSVAKWIDADEKNIVVVHCKAGKGRTGLMTCCWLVYSKEWPKPDEAMNFYAAMRTYNQKGITIPSQKRYVYYFSHTCQEPKPAPKQLAITSISFNGNSCISGDVRFSIYVGKSSTYEFKGKRKNPWSGQTSPRGNDSRKELPILTKEKEKEKEKDKEKEKEKEERQKAERAVMRMTLVELADDSDVSHQIKVPDDEDEEEEKTKEEKTKEEKEAKESGKHTYSSETQMFFQVDEQFPIWKDVRFEVSASTSLVKQEKLFTFWLNTGFIKKTNSIVLKKEDLDKAVKDRSHEKFAKDFSVEITFKDIKSPEEFKSDLLLDQMISRTKKYLGKKEEGLSSSSEITVVLNKKVKWEDEPRHGCQVVAELLYIIATLLTEKNSEFKASETEFEQLLDSDKIAYFERATAELQKVDVLNMTYTERLSFWLNTYNLLAIHGHVYCHRIGLKCGVSNDASLSTSTRYWDTFFKCSNYDIGGMEFNLPEIEHGILRSQMSPPLGKYYLDVPKFKPKDPQSNLVINGIELNINFAISCGFKSHPNVLIYRPENVLQVLEKASLIYLGEQVSYSIQGPVITLTLPKVLSWYMKDFGKTSLEAVKTLADCLPLESKQKLFEAIYTNNLQVKYGYFSSELNYNFDHLFKSNLMTDDKSKNDPSKPWKRVLPVNQSKGDFMSKVATNRTSESK